MGKEIISFDINGLLNQFALAFKAEIDHSEVEQKLIIPAQTGSGEIRALDFKNCLSLMIFDCQLTQEVSLIYHAKKDQPLRLIFSLESEIRYYIKSDNLQYKLSPMMSSMVSGRSGSTHHLILPSK